MRTMMLWGGVLGFVLAGVAGVAADRSLDLVLRDSAVACLAGAWLLRWWWQQLERALTETMEIRRRLAEQQAEAAEQAAKSAPTKGAAAAPSAPNRRENANPASSRSTPAAAPMPART